jgi:hypothetical protein
MIHDWLGAALGVFIAVGFFYFLIKDFPPDFGVEKEDPSVGVRERLHGLLRRHVSKDDAHLTDDALVRKAFRGYAASRETYLIDPNE